MQVEKAAGGVSTIQIEIAAAAAGSVAVAAAAATASSTVGSVWCGVFVGGHGIA